jgi:hypothetical protein
MKQEDESTSYRRQQQPKRPSRLDNRWAQARGSQAGKAHRS